MTAKSVSILQETIKSGWPDSQLEVISREAEFLREDPEDKYEARIKLSIGGSEFFSEPLEINFSEATGMYTVAQVERAVEDLFAHAQASRAA